MGIQMVTYRLEETEKQKEMVECHPHAGRQGSKTKSIIVRRVRSREIFVNKKVVKAMCRCPVECSSMEKEAKS